MNLVENFLEACDGDTQVAADVLNEQTGKRLQRSRLYQYRQGTRRIPYDEWPVMIQIVVEASNGLVRSEDLMPPKL